MTTERYLPESSHLTIDQMSAYIDRDLAAAEMLQVEAHLSNCEKCANELASLVLTVDLLRSQPLPRPSRNFQLSPDQALPATFWDRLGTRLLPALPALRAATIAVALLLSGIVAFDRLEDDEFGAGDSAPTSAVQVVATTPAVAGAITLNPLITEANSAPTIVDSPAQPANTGGDQSFEDRDASESAPAAAGAQEAAAAPTEIGSTGEADTFSSDAEAASPLESDAAPAPAPEIAADDALSISDDAGAGGAPNQKVAATPPPTFLPEAFVAQSPTAAIAVTHTPSPSSDVRPSGEPTTSSWRIAEYSLLGLLVLMVGLLLALRQFRKSHSD